MIAGVVLLLAGTTLAQVATRPGTAPTPGSPTESTPTSGKEKAKIEGRVVSMTSGEPVRRANLSLRTSAGPGGPQTMIVMGGGNMPPMPGNVSGATDNDGKFLIENIEPGRYYLSAEKAGFVRQAYGVRGSSGTGTVLSLEPGQHLKDLVFKLTPQGVISGRVLDEDGDPVQGVQVMAMRWAYQRGKRQLVPAGGSGSTNDQGEYRIATLSPGRYFLRAQASRMMVSMGPERPGNAKKAEEGFVSTYFPNAVEISAAAPIDVQPGAEMRSMDFRLTKTKVYRVSGKVMGPDGLPARNAMVMAMPREDSGPGGPAGGVMMMRSVSVAGGGNAPTPGIFEVSGLAPGSYILNASMMDGNPLSARHPVEIIDKNLEDVIIYVNAGFEVAGNVKLESSDPNAKLSNIRVNLAGSSGGGMVINIGGAQQGQVKDDGTFSLKGLSPDKYDVNVMSSGYVKSIKLAGQEIEGNTIDLTSGVAGSLDIVVSTNGGAITGRVEASSGDAAQGVLVSLAAVKNKRDQFRTVQSDQNGNFNFANVPPGEYRVYAWEDIESGAHQDPDIRKPFESNAPTVKVEEKGSQSANVKLISREMLDAAKAKM
jgi:protocatechuate 3,4-dioxygenase beta subunit